MQTETFAPPINLIEQFHTMQDAIASDQDGDKTRGLLTYFRESEAKAIEMQLRTPDFAQKQFAGQLQEGFAAASRIVSAAWQKFHGAELRA